MGSYAIRQNTLALSSDYDLSYVSANLVIGKASLTITAVDQSKVYGAALSSLTASYSGLVNGDTSASLTTPPVVTTEATSSSPVGNYTIIASVRPASITTSTTWLARSRSLRPT